MRPKVSVVVPVYNERENIPPLLKEIEEALSPLGCGFEVVMVDDGSRDGSAQLLEQLCREKPYLRVVRFRSNFGQTAAFDAGFRNVSGEIVVTMDADLQNDPQDIPILLAKMEEGYDFVTGWRRRRRDAFLLRTLPSLIANQIIRMVTRTRLHDLGCSLRAYRREITEDLRLYGEMHRFIPVLVEIEGARIAEVEVRHRPRRHGLSKYNLGRIFKVLLDLVTVWFLKGYRTKPIYVFGGVGAGCLLTSTLLGAVVLWSKLSAGFKIHRNPLFLVSIFLALVGIQFIILGLLAELVIRVYFESREQPPYAVSKRLGFDRPVGLPEKVEVDS